MRRTFFQLRLSSFPQSFGACAENLPAVAAMANECIERLVMAGGDSGWWGGWAKVLYNVTQANPFITLPAQFSRAINLAVCNQGLRIQNEFYELMEAGIGLQPPTGCLDWCGAIEGFERGVHSTMIDLPTDAPQYLRVYLTDPADAGKRVLIQQAYDQNDTGIYTTDASGSVNGFYLTLDQPFTTSAYTVTSWGSIYKDFTVGDVLLKAVNANTGVETLLSRYQPFETNPAYRRYYISNLPSRCCNTTGQNSPNLPVTMLCKYEFIPVKNDTDQLLIGNIPALIEEAQAIRSSRMEDDGAPQREGRHHAKAIKLLQDEMRNYLGERYPALNFAPFGTARLEKQLIGQLL